MSVLRVRQAIWNGSIPNQQPLPSRALRLAVNRLAACTVGETKVSPATVSRRIRFWKVARNNRTVPGKSPRSAQRSGPRHPFVGNIREPAPPRRCFPEPVGSEMVHSRLDGKLRFHPGASATARAWRLGARFRTDPVVTQASLSAAGVAMPP
jgi:hypothetical protein